MKKDRLKSPGTDSGTAADRGPHRTCVGCRKSLDQGILVRYVLSPQGNIVVDYRKKLPGRGVYTCPDFQCLQTAIKKGQLVRGLRGGDNPDAAQLWQDLHDQVRIKALNLLGMARKAGQILSGTRQVLCELQAGRDIALLIRAADLSSSIAAKVEGAALRNEVPLFVFSGKEQMGQLLGKSERGVVALKNGSLAVAIRNELERLQKFAGEFNG